MSRFIEEMQLVAIYTIVYTCTILHVDKIYMYLIAIIKHSVMAIAYCTLCQQQQQQNNKTAHTCSADIIHYMHMYNVSSHIVNTPHNDEASLLILVHVHL